MPYGANQNHTEYFLLGLGLCAAEIRKLKRDLNIKALRKTQLVSVEI